ncbi:ATP-binding cassette domain-containing protein [Pseudomonas helleri]|uniref:ATP-binding cassette domain-containing protein n=1 Tax=Pseudomonas helleri TaxID=1608996 RepID=A0A7X2CEH3_9PSED|nr:ATP-binding cassette domain-containing protein [Pseudomonas helleri]MQU28129.1 ATP-binding cassette domain-containing protein [Pseudomonas helleri]
MSILSAVDIHFEYPNKPLFVQTSLQVEAGQIVGILGPNGAGKTTFFDIVCGLKKISGGLLTHSFTQQLYLSQTVMTPPALRMFDIFRMTELLCSTTPLKKQHVLDKLSHWSPPMLQRYNEIWDKKSSLCSYGEKRWFFTVPHNVEEISENCNGFYMISQKQFIHFDDGDSFKKRYQADSLDHAFIKAAAAI